MSKKKITEKQLLDYGGQLEGGAMANPELKFGPDEKPELLFLENARLLQRSASSVASR